MSAFSPRVETLLQAMTLEEKAAQLGAYFFFDTYWHKQATTSSAERIAFIQSVGADQMIPPPGLGFASTQLRDLPARQAAEKANENQRHIGLHTRHRIPIIVQDEGVHGLIGNGATVFPSALGMAASWDPELYGRVADAIGRETRSRGIRQLLSPTLNLALDPRNGRVEETYGEDPLLASRFTVAFIRAVQSHGVVCTPKHFVANFEGDGGRDSWPTHFSERFLRELLLPPFEAAVREAGALSLMAAYGSIDGVPCSADRWLLNDLLRDEWGFDGYVVSDYHSVVHLFELHKVAVDKTEAARQALDAGLEVEFPRFDCYGAPLLEGVRAGRVPEELVTRAAGRVLSVKERIGLLDDCIADPDEAERISNCDGHKYLALEIARRSVVLLKNDGGLLPFSPAIGSLAVLGPNADSIETGDYSWDLVPREQFVTPLEGLRRHLGDRVAVRHEPGCDMVGPLNPEKLTLALEAAREADASVLFLGSSVRLAGEARDRTDLGLTPNQVELLNAVVALGKPVAVVILTGAVHTMPWSGRVPAILQAFYAGEQGGVALAEILFGDVAPSGKLPLTIPQSVGQCPLSYRHKPSGRNHTYRHLGEGGSYAFPFGHGLSYADFEYSALAATVEAEEVVVQFRIANRGTVAADEVVQLYSHDPLASVARPLRELVDFRRVPLTAGEERTLEFRVARSRFQFLGRDLKPVVEPGTIEVMVGSSSEDIRLRGSVELPASWA